MKKYFFLIILIMCISPVCSATEGLFENPIEDVIEYFEGPISNINACDKRDDNDDIRMNFDETTGTLHITGTGYITNFFIEKPEDYEKTVDVNRTIQYIKIGEGIVGIENSFNHCKALINVQFPESLVALEDAFNYCEALQEAELLQCEEMMQSFNHCKRLEKMQFSKMKELRNSMNYCEALMEIELSNDSGKVIESLNYCAALQRVQLSGWSNKSFNHCASLKKLEANAEFIKESFCSCPLLASVRLDEKFVNAARSFKDCPQLKTISCNLEDYTLEELQEKYPEPPPLQYDDDTGKWYRIDSVQVADPEPEDEPETETEPGADSVTKPEPETEPETGADSEAKPEPEAEPEPGADSATKPEPETETEPGAETTPEPDKKPPYLLYGIGGAVILLLALCLVNLWRKKKK